MDSTVKVGNEDLGRMISADWEDAKNENDFEFPDHETEMRYKAMFVIGYYYALKDMSNISNGLIEIDKILK